MPHDKDGTWVRGDPVDYMGELDELESLRKESDSALTQKEHAIIEMLEWAVTQLTDTGVDRHKVIQAINSKLWPTLHPTQKDTYNALINLVDRIDSLHRR